MEKWGSFCSYCGNPLGSGNFPRTCNNAHTTYLDWQGVGIALQPIMYNTNVYLLIIQRAIEPFFGEYALPGGYAESNETLRQVAIRELEEEAGVKHVGSNVKKVFWQAIAAPLNSKDTRPHMLQFEIMPKMTSEEINFGYKSKETKDLLLVRYSDKFNSLVDINENYIQLCFPLHNEAAINYLRARCK